MTFVNTSSTEISRLERGTCHNFRERKVVGFLCGKSLSQDVYIYIYTCYRLFLLFCFFLGILKLIDIKYQRLLKCNLVHWLDWWESCWHGTNMARAVLQSILVSRLQLYADVFAWQWWMGGASCCMLSAIPALEVYFGWVVWCLNTFHLSDSCWSVDECLGFLCCWTDAFGG